jgi:Flp pilus assembly protein TadB
MKEILEHLLSWLASSALSVGLFILATITWLCLSPWTWVTALALLAERALAWRRRRRRLARALRCQSPSRN